MLGGLLLSCACTTRTASTASSKLAVVSTTHDLATKAGLKVLKEGGNAADAASAIQFMLGVVQPQSTGIGGGAFLLLYNATTRKIYAMDGREEAPNKFHGNIFCRNPKCMTDSHCDCSSGVIPVYGPVAGADTRTGGLSVGIPGVPALMARLQRDHGTYSLAQTLQPAIDAAENGFAMTDVVFDRIVDNAGRLSMFKASAELYLDPANMSKPRVEVGEIFRNPDLGATMREMAADFEQSTSMMHLDSSSSDECSSGNGEWVCEPVSSFYRGGIASEIVKAQAAAINSATGKYGLVTARDMRGYRAVYRQPMHTTYRDKAVFGFPAPSAGGQTMLQALNLLEAVDLSSHGPLTLETVHRLVDVQNLAFADRGQYMGDADFVEVPQSGLLNKTYSLARRTALFSPYQAIETPAAPGNPPGAPEDPFAMSPAEYEHGTTHYSVVDRWGNAVAVTTTIEANFGSAVVVPGRGFILNNELTDFEALGADPVTGKPYANGPEGGKKRRRSCSTAADRKTKGGKRPRSSMSPTLVFNQTAPLESSTSTAYGAAEGTASPLHDVSDAGDISEESARLRRRSMRMRKGQQRGTGASVDAAGAAGVDAAGVDAPAGADFYAALGSPGGSSITGATLNVLLALVDFGLSLGEATDMPRVLGKNGPVLMETALRIGTKLGPREIDGLALARGLEARGFGLAEASETTATFGTVQTVIAGEDGALYGAADRLRHRDATAKGL